jgi:hypothetical protein
VLRGNKAGRLVMTDFISPCWSFFLSRLQQSRLAFMTVFCGSVLLPSLKMACVCVCVMYSVVLIVCVVVLLCRFS